MRRRHTDIDSRGGSLHVHFNHIAIVLGTVMEQARIGATAWVYFPTGDDKTEMTISPRVLDRGKDAPAGENPGSITTTIW